MRQATSRNTSVSDAPEVVERELVDDLPREGVGVPDRRQEQDEQRPEVDDDQPADRKGEQRRQADARVSVEERRETPPRASRGGGSAMGIEVICPDRSER